MSSDQEIIRVGRQLEKIAHSDTPNDEAALDLLKSLQGLPMTLDLLQKSRVGLSVNKIRKKCDGTELSIVAKKLIKSWKKLVPSSSGNSPTSGTPTMASSPHSFQKQLHPLGSPSTHSSPPPAVEYPVTPAAAKLTNLTPKSVVHNVTVPSNGTSSDHYCDSPAGLQRSVSTASDSEVPEFSPSIKGDLRTPSTGEQSRDKCRELIAKALQKGFKDISIIDETKFYNLGALIEQHIFSELKDTGNKYKMRIRGRVANLGDLKNPELRQRVISGEISPSQIAVMTAEEMASESMKHLRQKMTNEAIRDAQMSAGGGTQTDLLKCSKCKKRNCTYTQVKMVKRGSNFKFGAEAQTRSADEPMTTFAFCNDCGHRWKVHWVFVAIKCAIPPTYALYLF